MKNYLLRDGERYRDLISRYHIKSEGWEVDQSQARVPAGYVGRELNELLAQNAELLEICEPFLGILYDYVEGTDFFLELLDKHGIILTIIGDDSVVEQSREIGMVVGSDMGIHAAGTNAISIALGEDCAIQMSGADHYMEIFQQFTCAAAPIHNEAGDILGCINLNGHKSNMHRHTLGLVVAAAKSIENHISVNKKQSELVKSFQYINTIINSINTGVVALDSAGNIVIANRDACGLLGRKMDRLIDHNLFDFFEDGDKIVQQLRRKGHLDNIEVRLPESGVTVTLESQEIFEKDGSISGLVIILRDVKTVIRLVDRYAGMSAKYTFDEILGESEGIRKIVAHGRKIARSPSTVLISGESGTGKELFAQAIHNASDRKNAPFVAINCGAIPKELIESELFGYVEGAFTGAKKGGYTGKFAIADKGTLFLDEIGEMPLHMQVNLLRVLQEGEVTKVGANEPQKVDVRIIAATNKDLNTEVAAGHFREDLFYRLNVIPIQIPSLREREGDVSLLVDHFLKTKSALLGKRTPSLDPEVYAELVGYHWPGNIRELENVIESIVNFDGRLISPLGGGESQSDAVLDSADPLGLPDVSLAELERLAISQSINKNRNNLSQVARELGVNRTTLYNKIKKYELN